jgi:molybdate transport system substrate-binding protein
MRHLHAAAVLVVVLLFTQFAVAADEIRVMTSGAFTAAYLELSPGFERATGHRLVTEATSMGTGPTGIIARLERGEAIDVVIVSDRDLERLIAAGHVHRGTRVDLARSAIGMAVRKGAPRPDISSVEALKRTLLEAKSIAYSASVSGAVPVNGVVPAARRRRSRSAEEPQNRRRRASRRGRCPWRGRDRFSADQRAASSGGIDFVGPLPAEVQLVTIFSAGVGAASAHPAVAKSLIDFLASPAAAATIRKTSLEPVAVEASR